MFGELSLLMMAYMGALVVAIMLYFMVTAWLVRRRSRVLAGRQLVMEGEFKMAVHGEIVSIGGRRPTVHQVTCVYMADGRSCTIFGTLIIPFRPGTRMVVWRDRSDDRYSVEACRDE